MFKQKPLSEQTIVLTGATSGIGLATARIAAHRGANLVLVARNNVALEKLANEINLKHGNARLVAGDVSKESVVRDAAETATEEFGSLDTWINNAGVSIFGRLEDVPEADSRKLFDTNFWGVVNGSLTGAKKMEKGGGTLINIGSTLSDRAIPIQGMYCASKHAVKGFTEALRMELESRKAPIWVTLVKPAATDTPYVEHAKNFTEVLAGNPAPAYPPAAVAETILHCAENPVRDVFVGGGGRALPVIGEHVPQVIGLYMGKAMMALQNTDIRSTENSMESLHQAGDALLRERGGPIGGVAESSLYTKASRHPVAAGAAVALGLGAAYALTKRIMNSEKESPIVNQ